MRASYFLLLIFLTTANLPIHAQGLNRVFTKRDRLVYQGYVITRSAKSGEDSWTITVKKNKRILRRFKIGDTMSRDWARFGLFNFLGGAGKQLIVEGYSGGAHCCWQYKIIGLTPRFRVLYDSDDWKTGYELKPADLDKDGVYEFTQSVMTFDNFPISHADSRFPPVVFQYNPRAGKYLPANRRFPSRILQGVKTNQMKIAEWNQAPGLGELNAGSRSDYAAEVLGVFFRYLYSGQRKKAWDFFENNYKLGDKQEIMSDIKNILQGCAIYNYLYPQGR
jgi:hypothetical protein